MISQIFAVIIFVAMFVLIITEIAERHVISSACALLTLSLVFGVGMHDGNAVLETINIQSIFSRDFWYVSGESARTSTGINWETIFFVFGMMVMVEGMARCGFFRWLCMRIAKMVRYKVIPIFITFIALSTVLAMFIDSITVILFLAAVTIELSKLLRFYPVPMILAEVFCANLGGSATMCGDPPNIIIGTSLGYSFADFIVNTGLIVAVCFVAVVIYFYLVFRKDLVKDAGDAVDVSILPKPESAITDKKDFMISSLIFFAVIILLITHEQTGLTVSFIGVMAAFATLLTAGRHAPELL